MRTGKASNAIKSLCTMLLAAGLVAAQNPWENVNWGLGYVKGVVIKGGADHATVAVAGCTVSVWAVSNPLSGTLVEGAWRSEVSNPNGEFAAIPAGFYLDSMTPIRATKPGYDTALQKVQLSPQETTTVTIELNNAGLPVSAGSGPRPAQAAETGVRISASGASLIVEAATAEKLTVELYGLSGRRLSVLAASRQFSTSRHRFDLSRFTAAGVPVLARIRGRGFVRTVAVCRPRNGVW